MTWSLVFGFTVDHLSAVDRSVQTEPGLVRTTTDPARAAWDADGEAAADRLERRPADPEPANGRRKREGVGS